MGRRSRPVVEGLCVLMEIMTWCNLPTVWNFPGGCDGPKRLVIQQYIVIS